MTFAATYVRVLNILHSSKPPNMNSFKPEYLRSRALRELLHLREVCQPFLLACHPEFDIRVIPIRSAVAFIREASRPNDDSTVLLTRSVRIIQQTGTKDSCMITIVLPHLPQK